MPTKYPNQQRYIENHREWARAIRRKQNKERKKTVLAAYGNKCACCGEKRFEFLCIDHVYKNGNQDRKIHGKGTAFYLYLIRENFPSGHRVLCHNCNMSLGSYGYCPHYNSNGDLSHNGLEAGAIPQEAEAE